MKKIIIVLFLFLVGLNFVFADESGLLPTDKSTTLTLQLDGDKYLVGFSEENDFTHDTEISFSETIDESTMTVRLVKKKFYFFYKAITDESNVNFQIEVTPMYQGGSAPTGTDDEKAKKTINYTAIITPTAVWNGQSTSGNISLDTISSTTSSKYLLKASGYDKYFTEGIAKVVISSTDELGNKVPGNYTGTIKVTLSAT